MKNELRHQDCIEGMKSLAAGSIPLVFADPPFNINYKYDFYKDNLSYEKYLDWSRAWLREVFRVLAPDGTFWLAMCDEYAAELKMIMQREVGFFCENWVVWYYTFGVQCKRKFSRSHVHLFQMVKDRKNFTFNADDPEVRIPSARQLLYNDRRANPKGKLPDNTWHFNRVCGTFKERAGWHGCQMPEQLLGRIIRVSSRPGELVLDPFTGSGTTLVTAKKLGRCYLGFEISEEYIQRARERLDQCQAGDPLAGSAGT
ncbi:MAG: site-specific DNA-methyltransferase [Planctomycetia bacterium]|nr:site-specific DNA-methyltransferase [Planctomycetia bacterium]